jgi:hypothetical protein
LERICQNCRYYRPVEAQILDAVYLTDMLHMEGECQLWGWEVTADYQCENFELPLPSTESGTLPGPPAIT